VYLKGWAPHSRPRSPDFGALATVSVVHRPKVGRVHQRVVRQASFERYNSIFHYYVERTAAHTIPQGYHEFRICSESLALSAVNPARTASHASRAGDCLRSGALDSDRVRFGQRAWGFLRGTSEAMQLSASPMTRRRGGPPRAQRPCCP
jgi:hypothetical protein